MLGSDRDPLHGGGEVVTALEELRAMIDDLDEDEAALWLEFMRTGDPLLRSFLFAPPDDEPLTDEERAAIDEGWQAYREGRVVSADELPQRLGR
jgi:hypothetical protein